MMSMICLDYLKVACSLLAFLPLSLFSFNLVESLHTTADRHMSLQFSNNDSSPFQWKFLSPFHWYYICWSCLYDYHQPVTSPPSYPVVLYLLVILVSVKISPHFYYIHFNRFIWLFSSFIPSIFFYFCFLVQLFYSRKNIFQTYQKFLKVS